MHDLRILLFFFSTFSNTNTLKRYQKLTVITYHPNLNTKYEKIIQDVTKNYNFWGYLAKKMFSLSCEVLTIINDLIHL